MSFPEQENPSAEAKPKDTGGGGGPLAGIRQWLIDTYNGLYVIVLKPSMPEGILYGIGIMGLLIGLLWAYAVAPMIFAGGNPNRLNEGSQQQWIRMIAVGASAENQYGQEQLEALARAVPNPRQTIQAMLADSTISADDQRALQNLLDILPADIDSQSAEVISDPGFFSALIFSFIVPIIVMVVVIIAFMLLWRLLIYENLVAPIFSKLREMRDPTYAAEVERGKESIRIAKEQRIQREEMRKEVSSSPLGEPVMQNLAIFSQGRSFDESYEIELESGEFLGQSGAVISEAVDPDPVAIEVWLFDIFDSKTIGKTFITPQANADANLRNRVLADMDDPSDLFVATPDATLTVESPKLQLQAKFTSLEINEQGRFTNFKMVIRAWQKDAGGAKATPPPMPTPAGAPPMSTYDDIQFDPPPPPAKSAAGAPPMSTYDDIQFDPPPAPPSGSGARPLSDYDNMQFDPPPAPSSGGMQPLQPPPLRPQAPQPLQPPPLRRTDDDDPFGGTGDFTPLGKN